MNNRYSVSAITELAFVSDINIYENFNRKLNPNKGYQATLTEGHNFFVPAVGQAIEVLKPLKTFTKNTSITGNNACIYPGYYKIVSHNTKKNDLYIVLVCLSDNLRPEVKLKIYCHKSRLGTDWSRVQVPLIKTVTIKELQPTIEYLNFIFDREITFPAPPVGGKFTTELEMALPVGKDLSYKPVLLPGHYQVIKIMENEGGIECLDLNCTKTKFTIRVMNNETLFNWFYAELPSKEL